jgi:hypothetical protein
VLLELRSAVLQGPRFCPHFVRWEAISSARSWSGRSCVAGGASGAIIVEGIQTIEHAVAGLRQKILVIRDQNVAGNPTPGGTIPSWDLSVNFVPIA